MKSKTCKNKSKKSKIGTPIYRSSKICGHCLEKTIDHKKKVIYEECEKYADGGWYPNYVYLENFRFLGHVIEEFAGTFIYDSEGDILVDKWTTKSIINHLNDYKESMEYLEEGLKETQMRIDKIYSLCDFGSNA